MSEKRDRQRFCWEAAIKPDGSPEETEVRWYRRDSQEKQWQFCGNDGPSRDELSEEAKETLRPSLRGFIATGSTKGAARSHRAKCRS